MAGRILFADDGSPSADVAWLWINSQHWGGHWAVDVLTVTPDGPVDPEPWTPPRPRAALAHSELGAVRPLRCGGSAHEAIARLADGRLVVIGPRGGGLLKALGIGSTADKLIRKPPAPLLVAKRGTTVGRAMVCSDGSVDSLAAARALTLAPWIGDVDVHAVSVFQRDLDAGHAAAATAEILEPYARRVFPKAVQPSPLEPFPSVLDVLLRLQEELSIDLMVLGATGLSPWESLRAGSVAVALASRAPCSVLVVHAAHLPQR